MNLRAEKPVDFEALVMDLRRNGWSYQAIAEQIDASVSTVKDYANHGVRPKFDIGTKLVRLWLGVTRSTDEQLPRLQTLIAR